MSIADDLEDLLNIEKQAVLDGRLQDLPALESRKLALFRDLGADPRTSTKQLEKLQLLATRNAALLSATGRGVKAAIRQIAEANSQESQGFYGADGERKNMLARTDRLEQKV